jgi:flagellar protein FliS
MFGSSRSGANAYAKVGLETGVVAASPHKLIVMLFEGAIASLKVAQGHMAARQFEQKGNAISKTIQIIEEGLRASLDKKKGGEIAASLDGLYSYIVQRLVQANLRNDPAMVEEAMGLLADLKGAWDSIEPGVQAPPAAVSAARAQGFDSLAPRPASFITA